MTQILYSLSISLGEILILLLKWLFSSNSSGILTLTTGAIAILVYKHQLTQKIKEASIVLLNEIKIAEEAIGQIKTSGLDVQNETISIMTTCSWDTHYYIFASKLSRTEFELLNKFFTTSKAAQSELDQWRKYFTEAREEKGRAIQVKLISISNEEDTVYQEKRNKLIEVTNKEDFLFWFTKPKQYFETYLNLIPTITGSTIIQKLEKLAR